MHAHAVEGRNERYYSKYLCAFYKFGLYLKQVVEIKEINSCHRTIKKRIVLSSNKEEKTIIILNSCGQPAALLPRHGGLMVMGNTLRPDGGFMPVKIITRSLVWWMFKYAEP